MENPPKYLIAQCFFKEEQKSKLFQNPLYKGFGLEPSVNPDLFKNCPELMDPEVRLALTEYACFLWYYRNPDKLPEYFGTTSYRQLDKSPKIYTLNDFRSDLNYKTVFTWGYSKFHDINGYPIPISFQAEVAHPYINSYIRDSLGEDKVPIEWYTTNGTVMGNYWLMSKKNFIDYMNFSWPLVKKALNDFKLKNHPYFRSEMRFGCDPKKAVGYYMERLFCIWCCMNDMNIVFDTSTNTRTPINLYG